MDHLHRLFGLLLSLTFLPSICQAETKPTGDMSVHPAKMLLTHRQRPHSILASGKSTDGRDIDYTSQATYSSSNPGVASVDLLGWVTPLTNGTTKITVKFAGQQQLVPVEVKLPNVAQPSSFVQDVMPVLSKGGCNSGACHGYSLGKNGFKLSLRGSDPAPDFEALTEEFFERRINRHDPPASLLITKPLGDVPHNGGIRFEHGSLLHKSLLAWIEEGAKSDPNQDVTIERVTIHPEQVVLAPNSQQQLQLITHYSDGSTRDVSKLGIFNANADRVASVDDEGLVTTSDLGETAIVARFERIFATANFIVLNPNPNFQPTPIPNRNLIDRHVVAKLNALRIKPSVIADDATFLRRIFIDLIGTQPQPNEILEFLADTNPKKRETIIDVLFARPEFVDQWSLKWGDLLQNSRGRLSDPAVFGFREWLRVAVASNMPLDQFARKILTAQGGVTEDPTSAFFAVSSDTHDSIQRATQVFCGVRMLCARCHPHPFENWTQDDYYGLFSFFNQVTTKADARLPGIRNSKRLLVNISTGNTQNPRSGKPQPPRYLGGGEPKLADKIDRRVDYAKWLTTGENPHFAKSLTNRFWSYFFHRGIIDPVDDLRTTNPPINPELLAALTRDFVDSGFDMRHLMRRIVTSDAYQRSSVANDTNGHDDLNFSRSVPRRLAAETLLDALVQATGVPENFGGAPAGFTAKQLPDANVTSEFLALFGKPQRMEACECERDDGSNMLQALHFINGKSILSRVAAGNGRVALLMRAKPEDERLITELYLWSICRPPTAKELAIGKAFFASYEATKRVEAAQDLFWALLNSRDFMMVH
ncbi:MAG: DUF1553 domain-containing protein [Planctomycetota bacterium]|nr:DUF1553 domain-containing protein [Planctomycetota bacterium]